MDRLNHLIIGLPVFLLAVTLHEVAHGWTADRLGDPTAREQGRLTLNPIRHLDPLGTLFFVLSAMSGFGFGWARPVPVNMYRLGERPFQKMVLIAVAGPLSNLLQALVWFGVLKAIIALAATGGGGAASGILFVLGLQGVVVNLLLMLFNLLPIPPLDGSRIVAGFMPERMAAQYYRLSSFGFIILLIFLQTPLYHVFVTRPLEGLLGWLFGGLV